MKINDIEASNDTIYEEHNDFNLCLLVFSGDAALHNFKKSIVQRPELFYFSSTSGMYK